MPSKPKPSAEKDSNSAKPKKPHRDYPLFPHQNGQWAKKMRGKIHYFGVWNDPDGALALYLDRKDDLLAGRTPRTGRDGLAVRDLCNHFLTSKQALVTNGELATRTFDDYHATCRNLTVAFGLNRLVDDLSPADFEQLRSKLAETRGPVSLGNEIQRVRSVFKYAYDAVLIEKPVRFGPVFKRPSKRVVRAERNKRGPRMFEADQIQTLLDTAGTQLKAMILLGINCGFGNHDCGTLPRSAVDLKSAWIDFPRPKTGIDRRCPLWPETVQSLQDAAAGRPIPQDDSIGELYFLTKYGHSWAKKSRDNPITKETRKLLDELRIYRPGLGFYALRHTFETVGGESRDQVAVDYIMGHVRDDMASVYRERISDDRLKAVTDLVRSWLLGSS